MPIVWWVENYNWFPLQTPSRCFIVAISPFLIITQWTSCGLNNRVKMVKPVGTKELSEASRGQIISMAAAGTFQWEIARRMNIFVSKNDWFSLIFSWKLIKNINGLIFFCYDNSCILKFLPDLYIEVNMKKWVLRETHLIIFVPHLYTEKNYFSKLKKYWAKKKLIQFFFVWKLIFFYLCVLLRNFPILLPFHLHPCSF